MSDITIDIGRICVVIASHISSSHRIKYLQECIESLASQDFPVSIYLSISFETPEIQETFIKTSVPNHPRFFIYIRPEKTPQMKHIQLVLPTLQENGENWVLFCDDDDKYAPSRTHKFAQLFANGMYSATQMSSKQKFAGAYESTFGKTHGEQRHEFWCYGIHIDVLSRFYDKIGSYDDVVCHKCCDIVFGEYLRRSLAEYNFTQLVEPLYDYRVENNSDSITGKIKTNPVQNFTDNPPTMMDLHFSDYVAEWNQFVNLHMDYYMHDAFLRTVTGSEFDDILRAEFRNHYPLLEFADDCIVADFQKTHNYLREVCNAVYDIEL